MIEEYKIGTPELELKFLNLGAAITEINFRGKNRVLSFRELNAYSDNQMYLGAIVGRTAGRIKDGLYPKGVLPLNFMGKHNLHGNSLNTKLYDVQILDESSALLTLIDKAGAYNGDLKISIKFTVKGSRLYQEIIGNATEETLINITNHTYFNLNGEGSILNHKLKIGAEQVGVLNEEMITKKFTNVDGTAFDFRVMKKIEDSMRMGDSQFKISGLIDHPFKLTGNIELEGENCRLLISTNQPFVVCYAGSQIEAETNPLANNKNKNYVGICLETQKCPGDIELTKEFFSITEYEFLEK